MKTIVKGAIRDEKGYVLTLVLVLLVVGGLIIGPLLGLMSTGLLAGRVYENKMYEYYAADAGIEDALWRLLHDEVDNINWPLIYELPGLVNNKEVRVAIEPAWLLEGLPDSLNLPDYQPSQNDPRYGNDHWTVTGSINIENTANYIIDITSDETNAGDINVGHIGVWLPPGYGYVSGSTEINGVGVGENETVRDPDPLQGILQKDGTLLIWHFEGVTFKTLSDISQPAEGGCTPAEKFPPSVRLSFDYKTVGSNYVERVYDASGIFTPPAGVTNVTVEAWGGGGGGGGRSGSGSGSGGAGGGGGGAYAEGTVSVTPGTTYTVTVGAGGAGGSAGNNPGIAGGDSWFVSGSTVLAKGGTGGLGGRNGAGGSGGTSTASIGSIKYSGGNGASGTGSASGGGGGGAGDGNPGENAVGTTGGAGGIAGGGNGANGRSNNGAGYNGTAPGGGGSGACRMSGGPSAPGGAGGSGKVLVCYWTEEPTIAKGFFSWILLGDNRIAWDSQAGIFHIVSQAASDLDLGVQAGTTVETYTVRSFRRYSPGTGGATSALRGDYIAIGNSLMTSCWETRTSLGPPCDYICPHDTRGTYHAESSATIHGDAVPADARIEKAYLYWTAYLRDSNQPDGEVTLKVNDTLVGPGGTGTVEANKSYVVETPLGGWQYSCFADVTSQVKPMTTDVNGTKFTVGGVSATPATEASCEDDWWCPQPVWNELANAAWSIIIIYSSQEKETHQIYLYHDNPLTLQDTSVEFSVTGFEAPQVQEGNMEAQLGIFVAEGDPHYYRDYLKFKGAQSADFYSLGDPGEYPDTSDLNPYNNVFNGKSTATGFSPSDLVGQTPGRISGFDMDVYTKDKDGTLLSDIVQPGDTSATVRLETNTDYFMLVYVVFSVRSTVALGEGFDVGTMTYKIG